MGGWNGKFLLTSSVEVKHMWYVYVTLDRESMTLTEVTNILTKLNMKSSSMCVRFCNVIHHMAMVGIYHH